MTDHVATEAMRALAMGLAGDLEACAEILQAATPTPADGFAAACGFANIERVIDPRKFPSETRAEVTRPHARARVVSADKGGTVLDTSNAAMKARAKAGSRVALAELGRRGVYPRRLWKRLG